MRRVDRVVELRDTFTDETVSLRVVAEVEATPEPTASIDDGVIAAIVGAMAFGQGRYEILLDEMESRRSAVEAAALPPLQGALARQGMALEGFRILSLARV